MNETEKTAAAWATPPTVKSLWQSTIYYQTTMRMLTGTLHYMDYIKQQYFPEPAQYALSIGCGWGEQDYYAYEKGLCLRLHGIDISDGAIRQAKEQATRLGWPLTYAVEDLNRVELSGTYGLIFANAALHHVDKLERLYGAIANVLAPDGIFFFHEYCGPSRFQWTDKQLDICNRILALLPPRLRGHFHKVERMAYSGFSNGDPSEAIHSEEIVSLARLFFDVIEVRNGGTTLTQPLLNECIRYFKEDDETEATIIRLIFLLEEILIEEKVLESDTKLVVCQKRKPV
jgi:SAM-dependent methyltransferase